MKRVATILVLGLCALVTSAQKESGIVYSEHQAIQKTKDMWSAFLRFDKDAFGSCLADTVTFVLNGEANDVLKSRLTNRIDYWMAFDKLAIQNDNPATTDAIIYKDGSTYVQDWLLLTGTHKASGINITMHVHNLYSFNKTGKIRVFLQYFDQSPMQEIANSARTIENGKIYVNHPFIVTVRKCVNAYCAKDMNTWLGFFSPGAKFYYLYLKSGENLTLAQRKKEVEADFANYDSIQMEQYGYPDCLHYNNKEELWVVYSWWDYSFTTKAGVKKSKIPLVLVHTFDKEGKIVSENILADRKLLE